MPDDPVDPVEQTQRFLSDYVAACGLRWPLPRHSVVYAVCRVTFEHNRTIDDLERALRCLWAEKQQPRKGYGWFVNVIKDHFEDEDANTRT